MPGAATNYCIFKAARHSRKTVGVECGSGKASYSDREIPDTAHTVGAYDKERLKYYAAPLLDQQIEETLFKVDKRSAKLRLDLK